MKKAMCILFGNNEALASVDTYIDNPSLWEDHDDDAVNVPDGCTRLPCFSPACHSRWNAAAGCLLLRSRKSIDTRKHRPPEFAIPYCI